MIAQRLPIHFAADPKKVILLYLEPGLTSDRLPRFAAFAQKLSDLQADQLHQATLRLFDHRHRNFNQLVL
ncbi:MAG TPA: hypothetical protein VJ508_07425, partial [Saprospiraceae bacterium]|nr:hypothetical protein [Saprospiraceae bacterium]